MNKIKQIAIFMFALALLGAGCGQSQDKAPNTIDLGDNYTFQYLEKYSLVDNEAGITKITDGECLVYVDDENPLSVDTWKIENDTKKLGDTNFSLKRYRENGKTVRMDAKILGGNKSFSVDNPAGFVRCIEDFEEMLGTVKSVE